MLRNEIPILLFIVQYPRDNTITESVATRKWTVFPYNTDSFNEGYGTINSIA